MTTHHIVMDEPIWVLNKLTLEDDPDFDGKSITRFGDVEPTGEVVHGYDRRIEYECTCGEEFESMEEAEHHLKEIDRSDTGEQVTSP